MNHYHKLGGLYLVVSPLLPDEKLVFAAESALDGGVDMLQFSAGKDTKDKKNLASKLSVLAVKHGIPFLVNNSLELAKEFKADGVHFNTFDVSPEDVRSILGRESIVGYTVNIDLEKVKWAERAGADYVSFCSIFHQCPSAECPIVSLDFVKNVTAATNISVFAAGGINLENVFSVLEAGDDGIVVTSAILKSKDPKQTAKAFKQINGRHEKQVFE